MRSMNVLIARTVIETHFSLIPVMLAISGEWTRTAQIMRENIDTPKYIPSIGAIRAYP
jgi:hypothetical protein